MSDEKNETQSGGNDRKSPDLNERKIPDLHDRKINEGFEKARDGNYSDRGGHVNNDGYIPKPRISQINPPPDDDSE